MTFGSSARARFERFIGIGLGGGHGKTTAVARLERRSDAGLSLAEASLRQGRRGSGGAPQASVATELFRDDVLLAYLDRWIDERTVVAIDAPLTLPPCIRCRLPCPGVSACDVPVVAWMRTHAPGLVVQRGRSDPAKPWVSPYTQRATDLLLSHLGLVPKESLGQGVGPLAARAHYLRHALSPRLRLHENLLEIKPRAILARLFGEREERKTRQGAAESVWDARKRVLTRLSQHLAFEYVWPELVVRNVHVFTATIAAFAAHGWAREDWRGPPDVARDEILGAATAALGQLWVEDGWVWVPPSPQA